MNRRVSLRAPTERKDDVMSSFKTLALASAAASLTIAAAHAADLGPIPPPVCEPGAVFVRGECVSAAYDFSGWYLRGNIGITNQQVKSLDLVPFPFANTTFNTPFLTFASSPLFGVGGGYQVNNWLRFEGTAEYRANAQFHGQSVSQSGGVTLPDDYTAYKSEYLFLANAFIDLGTWWCVTPFVGAGIGASRNTITSFMDFGASTAGTGGQAILSTTYFDNASKWNFAWAFYAGLAYKVTPGLSLELTYRYVNLGSATTGTPHAFDGTPIPTSPFIFNGLTSNDLMVGMRWNLGEPPPPVPPLVRKG
jgi:opacity protein-like surface antigen